LEDSDFEEDNPDHYEKGDDHANFVRAGQDHIYQAWIIWENNGILTVVLQVLNNGDAIDSSSARADGVEVSKVQCKCHKKDDSDDEDDEASSVFLDLKKDLHGAFGALGVGASVKVSFEKNKSAVAILNGYNKSLELATNIKLKLVNCKMCLAEIRATNAPLDQVVPLIELIEDLCEVSAKAFKASRELHERADVLDHDWHCKQIKERLEEAKHQQQKEASVDINFNKEA
jgi:hypothetical protein